MENFVNDTMMPQESGYDETQAPEQDALSSAFAEISESSRQATDEIESQTDEAATPEAPVDGDVDSSVPKALRGRIKASEKRGYERGMREVEERYKADLEELNNYRLERDVKALAEQEKISESLARRLILAERGNPAPRQPEPAQQPQTTATQSNDINKRAQALYDQAQTIEAVTGLNVMEIFEKDAEVHRRVVSGEWDFREVARQYGVGRDAGSAPPPVRSANKTGVVKTDFAHMSDEEFAKFDAMLDSRSFDARR